MSFDIGRDLPSALHDRAAAWTYVMEFAESWGTPLGADDGAPEAELAAAEERLGVRLPAALCEAYTLFARRPDLHSNVNTLLSADELTVERGAVVFRVENQGAASWGVLLQDLDRDDPPVHIRADLADKYLELWEPWLDRFSVAALEIVLSESAQGPEDLCDFRTPGPAEDVRIAGGLTLVPFPADHLTFYTAPGVLIADFEDTGLCVRARDAETLDRFREAFPGDWVNA